MPGGLVDGEFVPDWLTAADLPWLRELLLTTLAFDGQPFTALRVAWSRGDVPGRAGTRWRPVLAVLRGLVLPGRGGSATALRARVFAAVSAGGAQEEVLQAEAAMARCTVAALRAALFADLGEQRLVQWPAGLDPDALRRATNNGFAQDLLASAVAAELTVLGASRALLRTAWLQGAHFRFVGGGGEGGAARLQWVPPPGDGPAGRRLAAMVPVLPWARRFVLRAQCRWRGVRALFVLSSLDALAPGPPPAPFDSNAERDLAAALAREWVGWEVQREPAPLPNGDRLAFPDFAMWRRGTVGSDAVWWLELAGLRDAAALPGKVALLQQVPNYVLCLPREKCPDELRAHPRVVPFRRGRVADVALALRAVVGPAAAGVSHSRPEGAAQ